MCQMYVKFTSLNSIPLSFLVMLEDASFGPCSGSISGEAGDDGEGGGGGNTVGVLQGDQQHLVIHGVESVSGDSHQNLSISHSEETCCG